MLGGESERPFFTFFTLNCSKDTKLALRATEKREALKNKSCFASQA